MIKALDFTVLSKVVTRILRHEPWVYELELDDAGWVPVDELLAALRTVKVEWSSIDEADIAEMISRSEKKRHEVREKKIRALYGHSVPKMLSRERADPPEFLYHGTSPSAAMLIKGDALRPMGRQYVHLSVDVDTANEVGRRKAPNPVLLVVNAASAHEAGVAFYRGNDHVWLADTIPAKFIG
jgi:putative RNA 2'-phosphotransferase